MIMAEDTVGKKGMPIRLTIQTPKPLPPAEFFHAAVDTLQVVTEAIIDPDKLEFASELAKQLSQNENGEGN